MNALDEELRQAYAQLPQEHRDPAEVMAAARRSAHRMRRRRNAAIGAGTLAATLVVGATAVIGADLGATNNKTTLRPAGASGSSTSLHFSAPAPASKRAAATPDHPVYKEDTDKPLAGLSGKLLPHGAQLPHGMAYRGAYTTDYWKSWDTSLADGRTGVVPLPILIGADQNFDSPTVAQTDAAYGILSGVSDMAKTKGAYETVLQSSIVRFRTPELARSAIAKTQRKEGGLYWVWKRTTPNIPWAGVPGVTGEHGVFSEQLAGMP